jgi:hypothetical protein
MTTERDRGRKIAVIIGAAYSCELAAALTINRMNVTMMPVDMRQGTAGHLQSGTGKLIGHGVNITQRIFSLSEKKPRGS